MIYNPASHDDGLLFAINSMDLGRGQVSTSVTSPSSSAWPLANLGLFVPFSVPLPCVIKEGWVGSGATGTGNVDIGIYDEAGTRLTSSGATAKAASTTPLNTTTMTDYSLSPNVTYYMAISHDGTSSFQSIAPAAGLLEAFGVLEVTSAYVLPSSVTYAKTTRAYVPHFGLNMQSTGF